MLTALRIRNYAIVSQLELDFKLGMTAFTGETGAGKSIMIDALMLALGGRADPSVIRLGASQCDIAATFTFEVNPPLHVWLVAHDIPIDTNELVLRRVLFAEGRSKSYINGIPFPLQKLKELSEMLVDIHGQHQHQSLLKHATHREQLDLYANHPSKLDAVAKAYQHHQSIHQALTELSQQHNHTDQIELLRYQLQELEELALADDELTTLHTEHQLLHHAREYLEKAQRLTDILHGEDTVNVRHALHEMLQIISTLPQEHAPVKNLNDLINNALIQCDEAQGEISVFANDVSLDPERLDWIEKRMSHIHQVARKFHIDASQLSLHQQSLQQKYQAYLSAATKQADFKIQYEQSLKAYEEAALRLRASRQAAAVHLARDIENTIRQLGMPDSQLFVDVCPIEGLHSHGMDKVEYKVSINPGTLPDTLSKVVSGGELSRISLGIHMITAQRGATPTLLFDEVDVGIGGKTAALVGQWLRQLGERLQLFCVTHQPQVAACAHHHFRVEKHTEDEKTFSNIYALESADRVQEIARMLGGLQITLQTRAHAEELLEISECIEKL